MRFESMILTTIFALAAPGTEGATPVGWTIWFYATTDHQQWCAVTDEGTARKVAASESFASGLSASLRYHGTTLDNVTTMTQSEDAYAEDSYTFGSNAYVATVVRRGHYINDPFFNVTFVSNLSGKLALTSSSELNRKQEEKAAHETYFVDWPLYRSVAEFPFMHLVTMGPPISITHPCLLAP